MPRMNGKKLKLNIVGFCICNKTLKFTFQCVNYSSFAYYALHDIEHYEPSLDHFYWLHSTASKWFPLWCISVKKSIRSKSRFRLFGLLRYPYKIQTLFLPEADFKRFFYTQQQCRSIQTDEMKIKEACYSMSSPSVAKQ